MKRLISAICIVICLGLTAHGDNYNYIVAQGEFMKCSPPKFLLVSDVDLKSQTLTGMLTMDIQKPQPGVGAYHRHFKLAEINVTNALRKAIDKTDFAKLKGQVVVISEGSTPLSAAFLGLFREDTVVITIAAPKE